MNATYGHLIGDRVLIRFTEVCQANLRQHDTLARYVGAEFVVLLPDTDFDQAEAIAKHLHVAIALTRMEFEGVRLSNYRQSGGCRIRLRTDSTTR